MMYDKQKTKKKRKHHKASIIQEKDGRCLLCMLLDGDYSWHVTQEHHVFGGPNRDISEAEGLKVYLCLPHHTYGREAVHNNAENMLLVQQLGQRAYEETHSHEEFMDLIGKNYL